MKASKAIQLFGGLFLVIPLWFFLLYSILSSLNVDRLVWFCYWAYLPISVIVSIAGEVARE